MKRGPHVWASRRMVSASFGALAAIVSLALAGCSQPGFSAPNAKAKVALGPVRASLPDRAMSYLGVWEPGYPASYSAVTTFGQTVGRAPNIVMYYLGWAPFNISVADTAKAHGATVLADIDPGTGVSLESIADGQQNAHLNQLAETVRSFGHPVILSFGHEMNGDWYTWGYKKSRPKVFIAAWRHIVNLFSSVGADNVTWLWTVNAVGPNEGPIKDWWPGNKYVTWTAIDGYIYYPYANFTTEFGATISAIRKLTSKPIFISETAVGQVAGQANKIPGLFRDASKAHLLGLMWFDEDQSNVRPKSPYKQDWRIEGNSASVAAFRRAIRRYMTP